MIDPTDRWEPDTHPDIVPTSGPSRVSSDDADQAYTPPPFLGFGATPRPPAPAPPSAVDTRCADCTWTDARTFAHRQPQIIRVPCEAHR